MRIRVFGTGCARCKSMLHNVEVAVAELGLGVRVEHVSRVQDMIDSGVRGTPTLALDDDFASVGSVLDVAAIKALLRSRRGEGAR